MTDAAPSQAEVIEAIEQVPAWVLDDNYASKTLRAIADLKGPDGTSETVQHSAWGTRVKVDQLLALLRRSLHVEKDESLALEIALLARKFVKDIPFEYPVEAISQTTRDSLLALANRIEADELEVEIRRRRETLAELDELALDLKSKYEKCSSSIESDHIEWLDRLDSWRSQLNPKAAELAGDHYIGLLRSRQLWASRQAIVWMLITVILFLASAATAAILVFDVSSIAGVTLNVRTESADSILAPIRGIVLIGITTGAMAWCGSRYQHRAEESRQLKEISDRIALTARLDATSYDSAMPPPLAYQLIERLASEPLVQFPGPSRDGSQVSARGISDSASDFFKDRLGKSS